MIVASRVFGHLVAIGAVTALLVLGLARASMHAPKVIDLRAARSTGAARLSGKTSLFLYQPTTGKLTARTSDGALTRDLELTLVVDGVARPIGADRGPLRATARNTFASSFLVSLGEETFDAIVVLRVDPRADALIAELTVKADENVMASQPHTFALRLEVPTEGRTAFVSGTGELGDLGSVIGRIVEIDAEPRALGIATRGTPLEIAAVADEPDEHDRGTPLRIAVTTAPQAPTATQPATGDLRFVIGASNARIWRTLHELAGEPIARVAGVVTGLDEVSDREPTIGPLPRVDAGVAPRRPRARVFGLDVDGLPRVRAEVDANGRFELDVPPSVTEWYAALDPTRTSAPVEFPPGTPWDLRLDVSPGGEIHVRVEDVDTGHPITARLIVHGVDGTLDPSFGPDYRASGAGPLIDSLRGEVTTPLPAGRYRVAATKGLEWSIDAKTIDVISGRSLGIDLALRHVVPTPNVVSCDLHVHARPSFDSPVATEDRVLSLVSAGIDFAVPSEHNIVGDYAPSLTALDLASELASVNGVEITTFAPRLGHFGLFPFPTSEKPPPYKGTNINAIFRAAKRTDASRVLQVNHPRLPKGIGYFELFKFDAKKPLPIGMRTDFDTLEVYNGYDLGAPARVEAVLHDWFALLNLGHRYAATGSSDSHRIQYQWAGYPRTMVLTTDDPIDTSQVVAAIKKGRSFVTTGPMFDVSIDGAHPGDDVKTDARALTAHVIVRAAPWVDVTSLEVVVGGRSTLTVSLPKQKTRIGPELGTREESEQRTLRYEGDLSIPVGMESTWVIFIARGERKLDDVLPFMPISPLGFTNPIFIVRP